MSSAAANWLGRRVLITGHTGFKGGWLAWMLARRGARLHGYALPPVPGPTLFDTALVASAFEHDGRGNVCDAAALDSAVRAARPEVVFHLAAQPLVRASYAEPVATFATNVMGTAHLLEAARRCDSVRAIVVVTSDKCYRDLGPPCREHDALGGHDPYSASKACTELVAASYRQAFELPRRGIGIATVRAGNVIGGGDWSEDRLVPDLLRAFDAGEPPVLRNPQAVRPWQHVLDPLAGYVQLAERLLGEPAAFSEAWNFGPAAADMQPVHAIARGLLGLAQADGMTHAAPAHVDGDGAALHEAAVLQLDSTRARTKLGWTPRLPLAEALRATWHWHRQWRQGADMRHATLRQINDHAGWAEAIA